MKFSTKATYGLKAMLYLADHYSESTVSISHISEEEGISAPYLEQILNKLKNKGWVVASRGPGGGYRLKVKPSEINIADLLEALGVDLGLSSVDSSPRNRKRPAPHIASELFWKSFSQGVNKGLSNLNLQQLVEDGRQWLKSNQSTTKSSYEFNI